MSFRKDKFSNFTESDQVSDINYLGGLSDEEVKVKFDELLSDGIHGFCFSLYVEGQQPGDEITEDQIHMRMETLKPHTSWIRTFACSDGNELIPGVAKKNGIKTLVGAWLGSDKEKNEEEIAGLIDLAKKGQVDIAAVGNEVLYRRDLEEHELLDYIRRVKEALAGTGIPVGYVDAYYEFVDRPAITEICDVILCNCYPFWETTSYEDSFSHMRQMYKQANKAAGSDKRVIITETGWPTQGTTLGGAIPSHSNALRYFVNTNLWAKEFDIETFHFSSFDESWKAGDEGDVGAYWGIWDSNGNLKF